MRATVLGLVLTALTGCAASTTASVDANADVNVDAPACVDQLIATAMSSSPGNPGYAFYECRYHGARVYYAPPQCCDQFGALIDETCTIVCAPDGGLSGGGDGRCTDFDQTTCTLVWSDPRTP